MSIRIAISLIVPPLLIMWRWRREPSWLAYVRYVVAVLFVWEMVWEVSSQETMIRVREAKAQGDIDGMIGDTGSGAAAVMVGWIPGFIYATLLVSGRWLWLWYKRKRGHHPVA
jgi:hypothetical protein